jgi:hypothetical protein
MRFDKARRDIATGGIHQALAFGRLKVWRNLCNPATRDSHVRGIRRDGARTINNGSALNQHPHFHWSSPKALGRTKSLPTHYVTVCNIFGAQV